MTAHLLGGFTTPFGKHPDRSHRDLAGDAVRGVLDDAGLPDGRDVELTWFANSGLWQEGQHASRGQVVIQPLIDTGVLPERMSLINVENACAGGSSAVAAAVMAVESGQVDVALALGVEKLIGPDGRGRLRAFDGALDQFDTQRWQRYYAEAAEAAGKDLDFSADKTPFMDTYATQAAWHMRRYGTTQRQIAAAAANAHWFGARNPKAQYRFGSTTEQVLADRMVSWPLTRAMCAPMGDGAAAVVVCSQAYLRTCDERTRRRAVAVAGIGMSGGIYRDLAADGLSAVAAARAYRRAGLRPEDVDVVEVHDATAFSHIYQAEMLGFCGRGEGGTLVERGETRLGGRIPMNPSGGLVAKGHPIAATGCSQITELIQQLRDEAGPRQVHGARIAMAENGGGVIGFDEAIAVVTILRCAP